MTKERIRKSWKLEAEILQRRVMSLTDENDKLQLQLKSNNLPKSNNSVEVPHSPQQSQIPKVLTEKPKKVEPQAPVEQKNTLEIEEAEEIKEKIKDKPKEEVEEFDYECPECSFKFNELNNDCCPNCNTELE